ncbi:nucleoside-diphosphate sugar epimerase [Leptospira perolatii]|uniref:Nucleoside-diphosphate sugar epimerase n=1 Tax=Leptospira perolatii TaxID=2023191 RepID=A0A2M9ZML1_9LEPT|nr:oxidoreductase [Leptospira perolatii]PJZ68496.1 nucleoside-diphosphate sugar epimerase [Leptospira perolatii]PJZ73193.1 nucleoside-diphosphate sugar epimerase [Leptospira perolatii]
MKSRIAIIAGGTGLIGRHLIQELLLDNEWEKVYVLVRKPSPWEHSKLVPIQMNWDDLQSYHFPKDATHAFCALGTTMNRAGSKENFRKVDYQYVIDFAKAAKSSQITHFSVVSALGADANSFVFYNKVKGEMEASLKSLGFIYLGIFRPSLLEGDREEFRFGEKLGSFFAKLINPLLFGPLRKYRSILGFVVAKAMLNAAWALDGGTFVFESDKIAELGSADSRTRISEILKNILPSN